MPERRGKFTLTLSNQPTILGRGAVAGKKEGEGPLGGEFDAVFEDTRLGEKTWEKAESALQREAMTRALDRAGISPSQLQFLFAGDLLNQNIASTFGLREMNVPLLGQFGACSTMGQTLALAAIFVDSGAADLCGAVTSSHFCTAERQYRAPLELGNQRTPTAQWTVTGAGAVMISGSKHAPVVLTHTTCGRVVDLGIADANNMGAAMAPAAFDTLAAHFRDLGRGFADYDLVVTGDLGRLGRELLIELLREKKIDVDEGKLFDCGCEIFSERQDVHSGGSGCGCAASMLCAHLLPELAAGRLKRVLFMATGALLSPTSSMQGESVPGIAHAVAMEHRKEKGA